MSDRATVGIVSSKCEVSRIIDLDSYQLGLQFHRGAHFSADDGIAHSIMDFWRICGHLLCWLGGNMVDISRNHGFRPGGCRSTAEGWLGGEGEHGATEGIASLRKATEPVISDT
jgi:hypothetical protein